MSTNQSCTPLDETVGSKLDHLEHNIRPFPVTATRIVTLCRNPDTSVREITELIECEPAISVKMLAMANSPLFGLTREITSISRAIVVLGYQSVSQMALMIASGPLFTSGDPQLLQQRTLLFRQSLGCATASRLLAQKTDLVPSDVAFLGGMMLDVGKLFFFDVVPEAYLEILQQVKTGQTSDLERERFGADHASVGFRCGTRWGLPHPINVVIRDHHNTFDPAADELLRIVMAGGYFARAWSMGFEEDEVLETDESIESVFQGLDFDELCVIGQEQFKAIESIFTA